MASRLEKLMEKLFGPVRQIGYVVRDIEASMKYWTEKLEVGPFFYFDKAPIEDVRYHGEPCTAHIAAALAQSGALQIELLQPKDETPSPYLDFLKAGREGVQHVAFWTERFDADCARAEAVGWKPVFTGYTVEPAGRIAYFSDRDAPHPGVMVELSAYSPGKKIAFDHVAAAAEGWDGSDPIRRLDG